MRIDLRAPQRNSRPVKCFTGIIGQRSIPARRHSPKFPHRAGIIRVLHPAATLFFNRLKKKLAPTNLHPQMPSVPGPIPYGTLAKPFCHSFLVFSADTQRSLRHCVIFFRSFREDDWRAFIAGDPREQLLFTVSCTKTAPMHSWQRHFAAWSVSNQKSLILLLCAMSWDSTAVAPRPIVS